MSDELGAILGAFLEDEDELYRRRQVPRTNPQPEAEPEPEDDPIGDALRADAVAYWKMDEASGTRADATANSRNLSAVGTVSGSSGKVGNGAELTIAAANGLRRLGDAAFRSLGLSTITFWGWARIDEFDPPTENNTIITAFLNDNSNFVTQEYLFSYNFGVIFLDCFNAVGDEYAYIESSVSPTEGQFFFFVFSIDAEGGGLVLRVNTTEAEEGFFDSTPAYTQAEPGYIVCVGADIPGGTASLQVDGVIDEVGCIDRLLTTEEKDYLYNGGSGRTLYP